VRERRIELSFFGRVAKRRLDRLRQQVHLERLEERQGANFFDEFADLRIVLMARDEDEAPGELRFDPFDRHVKHVARKIRHEQVAHDDIEITFHDPLEALDTIRRDGHGVVVGLEVLFNHFGESELVLDKQYRFGKLQRFGCDIPGFEALRRPESCTVHSTGAIGKEPHEVEGIIDTEMTAFRTIIRITETALVTHSCSATMINVTFLVQYHIKLVQSKEGWAVSCPALPGCHSQGVTREEAIENIKIAIREWLEVEAEESGLLGVEEAQVTL
jgi:predicted RNase H-like HicB family nuclease